MVPFISSGVSAYKTWSNSDVRVASPGRCSEGARADAVKSRHPASFAHTSVPAAVPDVESFWKDSSNSPRLNLPDFAGQPFSPVDTPTRPTRTYMSRLHTTNSDCTTTAATIRQLQARQQPRQDTDAVDHRPTRIYLLRYAWRSSKRLSQRCPVVGKIGAKSRNILAKRRPMQIMQPSMVM